MKKIKFVNRLLTFCRQSGAIKSLILSSLFGFIISSNSMARSIEFDAGLSEFILKNSPALVSQIKHQSGVGYSSLKAQLALRGCDASVLSDIALTEQKTSYAFFSYLMDKISKCSTTKPEDASEKQDFAEIVKGKTPYLLIAGESLNAPMSYFGHSLLLFLDEENFYFSPVLSVLAPLESKQLFSQTIKGGFSSIKAEINLTPLHQVISFYNNYEARSLRFIKLPAETFDNDKLIQYFDQVLTDPLAYNFFLKNCATYLYQALNHACDCLDKEQDIISPAHMEAQVAKLTPTSTVFELPSLLTQFHNKYQKLNNFEQQTVEQMIVDKTFQYQGIHQDLGDIAVLGSRLSFESYQNPYPSYFGLMDTYGNRSGLLEVLPEAKPTSDKELDKLKLSSFGLSHNKDTNSARFALLDYSQFYQRQDKVNTASLKAGVVELSGVDDTSRIEGLSLLEISTLKPLNFLAKELSWRVKLGAERNDRNELRPVFRYGLGGAISMLGATFYALPSLQVSNITHMPIYTGFETNMGLVSVAYENKDLLDHELTLYKRLNSSFALEYQAQKLDKAETSHTASAYYYF